jgi:hypothetical protein
MVAMVVAQEAYYMLKTESKRVNILDVCTPEECFSVDHSEIVRNSPIVFIKH